MGALRWITHGFLRSSLPSPAMTCCGWLWMVLPGEVYFLWGEAILVIRYLRGARKNALALFQGPDARAGGKTGWPLELWGFSELRRLAGSGRLLVVLGSKGGKGEAWPSQSAPGSCPPAPHHRNAWTFSGQKVVWESLCGWGLGHGACLRSQVRTSLSMA